MTNLNKVNFGVIGVGRIGKIHIENLKNRISNSDVVAISDSSKRALGKAKELGIKDVYLDYHDMITKSDIDAVLICLPNHLHHESSCFAAESGKDIFLEKPLARTVGEGESILIDCEESFVSSTSGRMVACLGLKNCLVVDTPEALLVADLGKSQEVKKIVELLQKKRKEDLL